MSNFKHILLSARWKVQDWEGKAGGGRRMGSSLWKRSDSQSHRMAQPSSSLEKLTGEEEVSLRMEEKRLN